MTQNGQDEAMRKALLESEHSQAAWDWEDLRALLDSSLTESEREALLDKLEDHPEALKMLAALRAKTDLEWDRQLESSLEKFRNRLQDPELAAEKLAQIRLGFQDHASHPARFKKGWWLAVAGVLFAALLLLQMRRISNRLVLDEGRQVRVMEFYGESVQRDAQERFDANIEQALVIRIHLERSWLNFQGYRMELWNPSGQMLSMLQLQADQELVLNAYFPGKHFQEAGNYRLKLLGEEEEHSRELHAYQVLVKQEWVSD